MKKKSGASVYIAALILMLGGVGFLVYSGFEQGSVYFLTVSEALAAPSENLRTARLFGTVGKDGLDNDTAKQTIRFQLEDKDNPTHSLWVNYNGVVPDTFEIGAEVIVEGGIDNNNTFNAKSLVTKCPSKYQKENREG